jgi:hypothetical protein
LLATFGRRKRLPLNFAPLRKFFLPVFETFCGEFQKIHRRLQPTLNLPESPVFAAKLVQLEIEFESHLELP